MLAVGIDSIDIVRMQKYVDNQKFLDKFFTKYEVDYCNLTVSRTMRMAGLFSAKEAFLKALGVGIGGGIPLNEIEIYHDKQGKPFIRLTNNAKKIVTLMGYKDYQISITHTNTVSTAICVLN